MDSCVSCLNVALLTEFRKAKGSLHWRKLTVLKVLVADNIQVYWKSQQQLCSGINSAKEGLLYRYQWLDSIQLWQRTGNEWNAFTLQPYNPSILRLINTLSRLLMLKAVAGMVWRNGWWIKQLLVGMAWMSSMSATSGLHRSLMKKWDTKKM